MDAETYHPKLPAIFLPEYEPLAKALLQDYFDTEKSDPAQLFSGAHFETLTGRWDTEVPSGKITAGDLAAVSCLSVNVPGLAAVEILHKQADAISKLLQKLPPTSDTIWGVQAVTLEKGHPAWDLWDLLHGIPGLGTTTTSKIMARKRANLIPIYDSVVSAVLGIGSTNHWDIMRNLMLSVVAGKPLHQRLADLVANLNLEAVTPLRAFDVIVWYANNDWEGAKANRVRVLGSVAEVGLLGEDRYSFMGCV